MAHVLIIDDAEDILELAAIGLEIGGSTSSTARSSQEALAELEKATPDLILLDFQLGAESGLDVLPLLKQKSAAPVVFLTAATKETQTFLDAGAAGVVLKPFDPMTLATDLAPWLGT